MMDRLGERIRKRRESLDIQLNDLANKIGVTSSLISQIERAKAFPSILTLKKIADALNTSVGVLIGEHATFMENPLLELSERRFAKANDHGATLYILSHHDPKKQMDPFMLEFEENGKSTDIMTKRNPRQEFCYVIQGKIKATLGKKSYELNEGDSFYFNSNQDHLFENINGGTSQLLWVVNQSNL